jgi:DNA-binding NtrC family response regulator
MVLLPGISTLILVKGKSLDDKGRLRFLVIEDSEDTARMIAVLLERRFDAVIDIAPTCAKARTALGGKPYDVVTLDYQLPDGSGLDMLDEIVAAAQHPPVIMITGHGDEELAYLAFRIGASGYAAKDRKLSVILPDEVEWAMADARLKESVGKGRDDGRLEGLVQTTHAMSRDLRVELEAAKAAGRRLEKAAGSLDSDAQVKVQRAASAIEKSLARANTLIDKLDSMVSPGQDEESGESQGP